MDQKVAMLLGDWNDNPDLKRGTENTSKYSTFLLDCYCYCYGCCFHELRLN